MKVCFVSNNIYPFLAEKWGDERIGGAELQQISIGKGLLDIGHKVAFITQDYGQPELEFIRGFEIYRTFKEDKGLPGFRFVYPRLVRAWGALCRTNADVYYVRGASFLPGILSIFCRIYGTKFIFAGAHDTDFMPGKHIVPTLRDNLLYHYGLRRASAIIVQSEHQQRLLWNNFRLKGTVIRNFLQEPATMTKTSGRKHVLWVATIREVKRPMHFLRLAEAFPSQSFVMIGGMDQFSSDLFGCVKEKAGKLPNLDFLGFQPFHKTEGYFDHAKAFVNTSECEGFPNTFLQAWRRGIPVISYVDPDDIIKKYRLGYAVGSETELCDALNSFLEGDFTGSGSIRKYYEDNHSSKVASEYDSLLARIA